MTRSTLWPTVKKAILEFRFPGLSVIFLLLAHMAFGFFLQEIETQAFGWAIAIAYIVLQCSVLSIAWHPARKFVLMGFKSDVGYSLMALAGASFAVVIVAWVQISTYFLTMLAAAILLRIKLYTRRGRAITSFLIMIIVCLTGLAISWVPVLIESGG
ncbi:MAG: hypothetical protein AAFP03_03785 [Cyanobacteria bacterium J06598_3]